MKKKRHPISMSTPTLTWWFTGFPGAGKTTLATALCAELRLLGRPVCLLDGDEMRAGLNKDLGFSVLDREENMRRIAEVARTLNANGVHAVVALVSPTLAGRAAARATIGEARFLEVHVATPIDVCVERDPKGLYARSKKEATLGLTGVQAPYEAPLQPELSIDTSQVDIFNALRWLLALMR